jgi:DNA-binding NarL/FixJ family response regulator
MRILVIDDHIQFGEHLSVALAGTGHDVISVLSPGDVHAQLARPCHLALVDMDFSRELGAAQATGLAALDFLHAAAVPAAIYAAEAEENRALFLLAAFRFFDPLAVIDKHEPADRIRDFVERVATGSLARPHPSTARYRTPRGRRPLLDRLIRNPCDLGLWQAVGSHDRRADVARGGFVSPRTLDKFLVHQDEVITEVEQRLFGPREVTHAPPPSSSSRDVHGARLIRVHLFAATHRRFFHDPTVRQLIDNRSRRKGETSA